MENEDEIVGFNGLLSQVMRYLSVYEVAEIDIEYLLETHRRVGVWWDEYRVLDSNLVKKEIKKSLSELLLVELERNLEQIR